MKQENVLADKQPDAAGLPCFKVSDFGLSLHLGSANSMDTDRVLYAAQLATIHA